MSLHAELSPEVLERLHAQRRNSTISSIAIAILTVALIALIMGIFLLPAIVQETPTIVTYQANLNEETDPEQRRVQAQIQRKPTPPSSSQAKVIVANTASPTSIQVPNVEVTNPSLDFGALDLGSGWGSGNDMGQGFGNIPAAMQKRCSPGDRLARLQETGGTPECEEAVSKALDWFQSTQNANGSWTNSNRSAMTGLALLAYLGRCETPLSKQYGETVLKAITYLVDLGMKNDGKLSENVASKSWPYEHSIATYALGEAATFCKQLNLDIPNLFEVTRKAGQFIIDNQHSRSGGWDYAYNTSGNRGGDLSIAAWHVQALKACEHSGLEFKGLSRASRQAMGYVESLQNNNGGFGYSNRNRPAGGHGYFTMTGAGLLSLQLFDRGSSAPARRAASYIEKNTRFEFNSIYSDLYGHYYEAQAMLNRGGAQWRKYNEMFRDQLLQNQNQDGSWKAPNGGKTAGIRAVAPQFVTNVHYRTALCTLMLEVYYRYLPGTGAAVR